MISIGSQNRRKNLFKNGKTVQNTESCRKPIKTVGYVLTRVVHSNSLCAD